MQGGKGKEKWSVVLKIKLGGSLSAIPLPGLETIF